MQATVRTHDTETRAGTALLDDGTLVRYDAAVFDATGLRLLRMGQRVTLTLDPTGAQASWLELSGAAGR